MSRARVEAAARRAGIGTFAARRVTCPRCHGRGSTPICDTKEQAHRLHHRMTAVIARVVERDEAEAAAHRAAADAVVERQERCYTCGGLGTLTEADADVVTRSMKAAGERLRQELTRVAKVMTGTRFIPPASPYGALLTCECVTATRRVPATPGDGADGNGTERVGTPGPEPGASRPRLRSVLSADGAAGAPSRPRSRKDRP